MFILGRIDSISLLRARAHAADPERVGFPSRVAQPRRGAPRPGGEVTVHHLGLGRQNRRAPAEESRPCGLSGLLRLRYSEGGMMRLETLVEFRFLNSCFSSLSFC